jgi:hypothetical protein
MLTLGAAMQPKLPKPADSRVAAPRLFRLHFRTRWRLWTLREVEAFLASGSPWIGHVTRIERL